MAGRLLLASARRTLDDQHQVGTALSYYTFPAQKSGPDDGAEVPFGEIAETVRDRDVLLLVHGYNNDLRDVTSAYALIQRKLDELAPGKYGAVVGLTWPSSGGAQWPKALKAADRSAPHFGVLGAALAKHAASIDVMTHSLGARVALQGLTSPPKPASKWLRNLWLTAPAVDDESVEQGEVYYPGTARCERVFCFYSRRDEVLRTLYQPAMMDRPLGLFGPDSPDTLAPHFYAVNCKRVARSHGAYRKAAEVYDYIGSALDAGGPAKRWTTL